MKDVIEHAEVVMEDPRLIAHLATLHTIFIYHNVLQLAQMDHIYRKKQLLVKIAILIV